MPTRGPYADYTHINWRHGYGLIDLPKVGKTKSHAKIIRLRKVDQLTWMTFITSLTQSLAWPTGVFGIVVLLRRPLSEALSHGIRRLKAGPVEIEFDQEATEVRQDVRRIPEVAAAEPHRIPVSLADELASLAKASPRATVLEAFTRVEERLDELLDKASVEYKRKVGGTTLAKLAFSHELISPETRDAVQGLSALRNLAAHSPHDNIGTDRALDYVAMADAVLYAMRERSRQ